MTNVLKNMFNISQPVRFIYNLVAVLCMIFTIVSLVYGGYFAHRAELNDRLVENYVEVEKAQTALVKLLIETLPSKATNDTPLSNENAKSIRTALADLAGSVSRVDGSGDKVLLASKSYRGAISSLSGAVVRYSPDYPITQFELLKAVDDLDKAMDTYANALERRTGSFIRTLWPSV